MAKSFPVLTSLGKMQNNEKSGQEAHAEPEAGHLGRRVDGQSPDLPGRLVEDVKGQQPREPRKREARLTHARSCEAMGVIVR